MLAKQGEEYAAYVARIGMAAAKIDENAFDTADSLLAACLPAAGDEDLRNWEWGYLKRLRQSRRELSGATGAVTLRGLRAGWQVVRHRGRRRSGASLGSRHRPAHGAIDHGGAVHAVAVSPDGQIIATAGADGHRANSPTPPTAECSTPGGA